MKPHSNATLTIRQRRAIRRLYLQGRSVRSLAAEFHVCVSTIEKWAHRNDPYDRSSAPKHPRTVITPEYRQAVLDYRDQNPTHGPITIAWALKGRFPQAKRNTVLSILQQAQRIEHRERKPKERHPIPVGRHRVQIDIQDLPAIEGGSGFEYKISAIHLRTRMKYSEIHPNCSSETIAEFLRRAMDRLPPFTSSGQTTPGASP